MDNNFWESVRQGFMQLRADCAIDPPLNPAGRLSAIWTAEREQKWRLNYHKGKDGNGVIERFTWAVESAAARLGFAGNGREAVSFWLDRIKRDAPAAYLNPLNVSRGETEEVYSVEILDICGLSADYCRKCQADEIRSRALAVANGIVGSPRRDAFQPESTSALGQKERLDGSQLPELTRDAAQRIAEVLKEARAHVSENPNETRVTQAMALYLDSIAWEYALTQSSTVFEALIDGISAKARGEFAGDLAVAEDRKRYWIKEAQERAANEIVGRQIPIRVAAYQAPVFHDLELLFRALPSKRGDLHAVFFDEVRFNVFSENPDPTEDILERQKFELLARQAMAALGFRFADSSRSIFYWLQFLKQKSPHFKQWKCHRLCAASADFCAELKTRAGESAPREGGPLPQTVAPGTIPSGQRMGGSLQNLSPAPVTSRRSIGNPIMHVDLFFPLRRHSIIPGAEGPASSVCEKIRDEIIRIADRIQALENPDFPAAEAGDRWLDRLSPSSPAEWEIRHLLDSSVLYCRQFATHLIRSGKKELAASFDDFALQFDALRNKYFTPSQSPAPDDSARTETIAGTIEGSEEIESPTSASFTVLPDTEVQVKSWEEVEIRFLSDERVQITVGKHTEVRNYAEFGFEDGRSQKPNQAWTAFRFLAQSSGAILQAPEGHRWDKLERRIMEIRKRLRAHFKLDDDPIPFGDGYRARFKISCAPSYHS